MICPSDAVSAGLSDATGPADGSDDCGGNGGGRGFAFAFGSLELCLLGPLSGCCCLGVTLPALSVGWFLGVTGLSIRVGRWSLSPRCCVGTLLGMQHAGKPGVLNPHKFGFSLA